MLTLVSTSPRRKVLLKKASKAFRIVHPSYHEKEMTGIPPEALVKRHAFDKAMSVIIPHYRTHGNLLACDTIVYFQKKVIGKPKNIKDAVKILRKLGGRWHTVYTGVALLKVSQRRVVKKKIFHEITRVKIKKMTLAGIRRYFKKVNPLDKAGAYAIQSRTPNIVEKIQGSFSNAMGLPIEKLGRVLRRF